MSRYYSVKLKWSMLSAPMRTLFHVSGAVRDSKLIVRHLDLLRLPTSHMDWYVQLEAQRSDRVTALQLIAHLPGAYNVIVSMLSTEGQGTVDYRWFRNMSFNSKINGKMFYLTVNFGLTLIQIFESYGERLAHEINSNMHSYRGGRSMAWIGITIGGWNGFVFWIFVISRKLLYKYSRTCWGFICS